MDVTLTPKKQAKILRQIDALRQRAEASEAEVARLSEEVSDHDRSFELRWAADMRAIARWRKDGPGRELTLPDHADLCVWLLDLCDKHETEVARLRAALAEIAAASHRGNWRQIAKDALEAK